MTEKTKQQRKEIEEEYKKYLNEHSGQAYKCLTFEEFKWKRELGI